MSRPGGQQASRPRLAVATGPAPAAFAQWLAELAFGGADWSALLVALADQTGAACRLVTEAGTLLAASDGVRGSRGGADPGDLRRALAPGRGGGADRVRCADGWTGVAVAVGAGPRRLGALLVAAPVSPEHLDLARAAATALLIEAVRRESSPPDLAEAATVLRALRQGVGDPSTGRGADDLLRAGAAHGWRLDQPHAGVAIGYTGTQHRRWASALNWLDRPVLVEGAVAWTLLAGNVDREVTVLRTRLDQLVGAGLTRVASGPVVSGAARTVSSFRDADRLLRLLLRQPGERPELPFSAAGLGQLLLAVPEERLRWFVDRHLGPITHREDLLSTLDCWLATGGSRQAVSERLHLHRNSVGYRVGLIKRLLGVDPLDPRTAPVLRTALAARELLAADAG
ncbi:PucR family transcriptional regulator [Micromonospora endophytica]|uniref:Uncharacterized protein n=1 Tax=Micromonospora endophytica TaxID=515350 RepID=A0A2W2D1V9_9ACTN|nr:PucR family transcriptional regulator [Micromonospora endophytica]PZF99614.1 hypothetical protein C1I93_05400 [Micromonospora endophytica]RIW43848.1 PucR family transcriptional regulator [Micromonospora endophytica]BCJ56982.1 hypothetical protein Jiend_04040 [Micromonospora endophytica]